jgi:hypothetical protein
VEGVRRYLGEVRDTIDFFHLVSKFNIVSRNERNGLLLFHLSKSFSCVSVIRLSSSYCFFTRAMAFLIANTSTCS